MPATFANINESLCVLVAEAERSLIFVTPEVAPIGLL